MTCWVCSDAPVFVRELCRADYRFWQRRGRVRNVREVKALLARRHPSSEETPDDRSDQFATQEEAKILRVLGVLTE